MNETQIIESIIFFGFAGLTLLFALLSIAAKNILYSLLFAVIAFLFGVFMLMAAIGLSAFLGMISFPFILVHNIHTGYSDAL